MIVQQNMIASASTRQAIGSLMQSQNSAASSAPVSLNPIPNNTVTTVKINNKQIIIFLSSLVSILFCRNLIVPVMDIVYNHSMRENSLTFAN